jgi:hypothetical protein
MNFKQKIAQTLLELKMLLSHIETVHWYIFNIYFP